MSENKFIAQLKGNAAPGSVLEIQDKGSKTSFANMPSGTSDAIVAYSDKRNNATAVLKGAMNWKVNGSTLSVANPAGDGSDYTGQTAVAGISDQQGNNLWINASYTVPADGLFLTKNTKWVLKLCGDNLIVNGGDTAEFTVLITAGNSTIITKKFFVGEQANQFCKELVIDFAESNISGVKLEQGDSISLKLLCDIPNASARIYQGMTTLTLLQRAVDAENVISNAGSFEEVVDDINYLENHIIVKSATMPTASADLLGEVYQYTGATAYPYEHGYIYECMQTSPGVYAWERIDVQPGGSRGRFLSLWDCTTGLAETNPAISPFEYKSGDYFIVSKVGTTNYKPTGTEYIIGQASTVVETGAVSIDDTYFFDGTNWKLQATSNDIKALVDTKVSKDGSSIMTGPLKFRAGSFEGAIAGGLGDGVSVYKMNADGSINSEVAALTKTNGFIPGTTNSMNIGSSSLKWKDAYIGRVISGVLNNGADINVPTTAGTLALKSDIGIGINNISNCITEIPQDIKLELSSGTLTLKAGSKVYMPNGAGVFNTITINANKTFTHTTNGTWIIIADGAGNMARCIYPADSGSTQPGSLSTGLLWYDTTNNYCKRWNGSGWDNRSFPIAIVTVSGGQITSIDQVFNGFGYIGSTLFALPGVKGLIPNGRNADGTLKNISVTNGAVRTITVSSNGKSLYLFRNSSVQEFTSSYSVDYNNTGAARNYCLSTNTIENASGETVYSDRVFAGFVTVQDLKIVSFVPKLAFQATDYSEAVLKDYPQQIDGQKTITSSLIYKAPNKIDGSDHYNIAVSMRDSDGTHMGYLREYFSAAGGSFIGLQATRVISGTTKYAEVSVGFDGSNNAYAIAPTPGTTDKSTKIATTEYTRKLLETIYPVGSLYFGTQSTCPLASLFGTWTRVPSGYALWTGNGNGNTNASTPNGTTSRSDYANAKPNTTITAGVPNITSTILGIYANHNATANGAVSITRGVDMKFTNGGASNEDNIYDVTFDASQGGTDTIYGKSSTVQPPAYIVNVWRRTA